MQRYVLDNQPAPNDLARIDRALDSESLPELRSLTDHYRRKTGRENQIAREQQREIQWLVSEFEAVPQLKRRNEAREAWKLYERALSCDDAKAKIHSLKEARKKLPRELRELKAYDSPT